MGKFGNFECARETRKVEKDILN